MKNYYDIPEIQNSLDVLEYPASWECWALAAFMMPANVGEYLRAKNIPMDVLEMKREIIRAMTDGKKESLTLPNGRQSEYDIEPSELIKLLTHRSLTNYIAFNVGYSMGSDL